MIAIFETGGKQYKVQEGDRLLVEKILPTQENRVVFEKVLLVGDEKEVKVGNPYLEKVKIEAKLLGEKKGEKKIITKHKPKKRYLKKQGHRQVFSEIEISKIAIQK